jgi:hypothetical protein
MRTVARYALGLAIAFGAVPLAVGRDPLDAYAVGVGATLVLCVLFLFDRPWKR